MRPTLLLLAAVIGAGCASGGADSPPPPAGDPAVRTESAQRNVEASAMSPEQKAAANAYLSQGAANAERMRQTATETAGRK